MTPRTWSALVPLVLVLSASATPAQTVERIRIVLPQPASAVVQNIASVLAGQVARRCDASVVTDGEAPLTVELAIAPGIGTEGFRIEDRPDGGVKIVGNDHRGLFYGVGKLLRTSRYDEGGFKAGSWRGTSIPEKPVRGIYFATHFHNFYHDAPIDQVQRYVEEVGLWGLNTLLVWYDMHHFQGFDSPEAVEFRKRLQAICGAARRVGLDVGFACVANEGHADSPQALRADVKGMRGAAFSTDICTATEEGRRYVLDNFARLFDWATDLEPKWVMIWPYDSGGCGCRQCQPWGHGGYLRSAQPLANLAQHKLPGAKVILSTWFFDDEEWAGLARAFVHQPNWVDYLLSEPAFLPATSNSPPTHPSPGNLPLVGFPEISMVGWPVWGGFGANPLPTRYEGEWKALKAQWQGGFPYSEGIFEDINKILWASFYWQADITADEALGEYIAFEYSPEVVHLVLPAIQLLERHTPGERTGAGSLKARDLIAQADARLTPQARQAWRWRILFLRAQVDAQLYLNRGAMQGQVLHDAFQELTRIYHAQNAEPPVKPPQVDPTDPPPILRSSDFQGPGLAEAYHRAVLSSTPMAYWRMSEVAADRLEDASSNAHSAITELGVDLFPPTAPVPANPAAIFSGGRMAAAIDLPSDAYSVELWVQNDLPPNARAITTYFFSRGVDGPPGTAGGDNLGIGGTHCSENQGKLFFFNGTEHDQVVSGKTPLPSGRWHHVVLVRNGGNISVYLNGGHTPEICGQAEIGYPAGCGQLFFGGRNDGFAPLEGKLDEVSVYNRALSADEIVAHYAASQPPATTAAEKDPATIPTKEHGDIPLQTATPEDKPRAVSQESVKYLQELRKGTPFGAEGFDLAALRAGMGSRREPTIKDIKLMRVMIEEIPCEWVLAPGADPDIRLLYLHGGGFVSGSGGFYLPLAAHLSAAARCAVLLPDYRLAPEHRFPAAVTDCVRAHQWLIANGPTGPAPSRATFIAGDSAGGNLTLATLLALRDRRHPLPVAGIALSPTTDLTLASESLRTVSDPIISASTMSVFRDYYLGQAEDAGNPLASPLFGDYRGLPPLLIQVGEHEMLRDDSVRVARKARADGIPVKLEIWPGMFHVFQSHEPLLPEGREAIDHIADFMRSSLPPQ
ncbi:MAG: alpha/beta hydrolase fold domain-containing protein [Pirellulaceae bacterium]